MVQEVVPFLQDNLHVVKCHQIIRQVSECPSVFRHLVLGPSGALDLATTEEDQAGPELVLARVVMVEVEASGLG